MKRSLQAFSLAVALLAALPAQAQPETAATSSASRPEMNLDAQARSLVDNDLMTVHMSVEAEGPRVQELSQRALAVLQKATARAKAKGAIEVRMGSVSTTPVWGPKGRTANWQVRGDISLSSTDVSALGLLASELTADMQLNGVNFSLSRDKRDEVEAKLIDELALAFKRKAQAMAAALGFKGYAIKNVALQQQGGMAPPMAPMMMMKGAGMAEAAAVPVPAEGGKTEVILHMSGTAELR